MDGILILDKPCGITSTKVVNKIKKIVGAKKAGHTGTLDPFATGVLPICFNEATKAIPYLKEDFKEYEGEMVLGISTDTMDRTGEITQQLKVDDISENEIKTVLSNFIGKQEQVPPMYSALQKDGIRLYKLARKGKEIEREPRKIYIKKIELIEFDMPNIKFRVECSKGTYVRVLCSDIGQRLGFGAHLISLKRLSSGKFNILDSYNIHEIEDGQYKLFSLLDVLSDNILLNVDDSVYNKIKIGVQITKKIINKLILPKFKKEDIITVHSNERVVSISKALIDYEQFESAEDEDIIFQHLRVFN